MGTNWKALPRAADFEQFRPELDQALAYADGGKGGRPPINPVLMFKVLVIQAINTLSDERTEYLINDRLSFMRFLGLGLSDRVPDAKTIWLFRERLTKVGAITALFARFDAMLREGGYIPMTGQIVDASLMARTAPAQHQCREGRHQGRPYPQALAEQARQAPSQGPRCALDLEVHPGQTARGWLGSRHGSCYSGLRLQEPHIHRQPFPAHSVPEEPRTPGLMTAPDWAKVCSIPATLAPPSGPIQPIAQQPTSTSWKVRADVGGTVLPARSNAAEIREEGNAR